MDWTTEEKLVQLTWLFDAIIAQAEATSASHLWRERDKMLAKMRRAKKTSIRLGYKLAANALDKRAAQLYGKHRPRSSSRRTR